MTSILDNRIPHYSPVFLSTKILPLVIFPFLGIVIPFFTIMEAAITSLQSRPSNCLCGSPDPSIQASKRCTVGKMTMKSTRRVLGHLLLRLLLLSHRSLICLLRTACFALALRCAHSLARSLTPELMRKRSLSMNCPCQFRTVSAHRAINPR